MDSSPPGRSVEYESVSGEYLAARQLKRGAAGWVLLAGLGVSYVISGTTRAGTWVWPRAALAAC